MADPCLHETEWPSIQAALRDGAMRDGAHREAIDTMADQIETMGRRVDDLSSNVATLSAIISRQIVAIEALTQRVAELSARVESLEKRRWWNGVIWFISKMWAWMLAALGAFITVALQIWNAEIHDIIGNWWR